MSAEPPYSIKDWCKEAKTSPAMFYKQQRLGLGPLTANWGRRTFVIETPLEFYRRIRRKRKPGAGRPRAIHPEARVE